VDGGADPSGSGKLLFGIVVQPQNCMFLDYLQGFYVSSEKFNITAVATAMANPFYGVRL
jgi:hypothetical protein